MYDLNQVYEANSVEEAIALRQAHPEAQIIAGGSDVLVQVPFGPPGGQVSDLHLWDRRDARRQH